MPTVQIETKLCTMLLPPADEFKAVQTALFFTVDFRAKSNPLKKCGRYISRLTENNKRKAEIFNGI
jgi:hypothetical protein